MIRIVDGPPWPRGPMILRLDAVEALEIDELATLERRDAVCIGVVQTRCEGAALAAATAVDLVVAAPGAALGRPGRWRDVVIRRGTGMSGRKVVAYLAMTRRTISAERARGWGLVTALDDDPMTAAAALAEAITARSPVAVATILRQGHRGSARDYAESRITGEVG